MQGDVGIFGGIGVYLLDGDLSHGELLFPLRADELFDFHRFVTQIDAGQIVHVVVLLGLQQVVGHHGVEEVALDLYPVVVQHDVVVFDILPDLERGRVFESRFEDAYRFACLLLVVGHGHVIGLVFFEGKGESHQFDVHGVDAGRLGVEGESRGTGQECSQVPHLLRGIGQVVGVGGGVDVGEFRLDRLLLGSLLLGRSLVEE